MADAVMDKLEEVGKNWEQMKKTADDHAKEIEKFGKATGETTQLLEKLNGAIDKSQDEIKVIKEELEKANTLQERLDKIDAHIKKNGGLSIQSSTDAPQTEEAIAYKKAWNSWLKYDIGGSHEVDVRKAYDELLKGDELAKNLAVNFDPAAGLFVPTDTSGKISTVIYESSNMRQVCAVQQISTDALEGAIDEGRANFTWVGEVTTPGNTDLPNRGIWRIPVHEAQATVLITQKLLEDSIVDQEAWSINKIAEEFARGEETAFVVGVGNNNPRGILTYPVGSPTAAGIMERGKLERVMTGAAGDMTDPDALLDLIYKQKKMYRTNSRFAFAREGIFKARLMKMDSKYVWQPGLQAGEPDRLLGYAVEEMNDIPDFANGALVGIFADFAKGYQIVDRIQMSLLRDPYSNKPFVEIYARKRIGGDVRNFDCIKLLEASV